MMFLLDLFKFCEGYDQYTRQHIAKFIFGHAECGRMAEYAGLTPRQFASVCSREFCGRAMTEGYLNCDRGTYICNGRRFRPKLFTIYSMEGEANQYIYNMLHMEDISDEEFFDETKKLSRSDRRIVRPTSALTR